MNETDDNNPLFPDPHDRLSRLQHTLDRVASALARIADGAASPTISETDWRDSLSRMDFKQPREFKAVIDWLVNALSEGTVHMTHPGHLGLFNPKPSVLAEAGDLIAAAFNPQVCVRSHAPVAVDIERHTIEAVADRAGMPEGSGGHFTSGGSEANATAVLCALTQAAPTYADEGVSAFDGTPRIYVSAESHLAWLKIAHQCGIGRNAVRLIATDGNGAIDIDALRGQVQKDRQDGDVAVLIVATAGTTNAGMIDSIAGCRDIADSAGCWLHVDAAWGGAIIASDRYQTTAMPLGLADSITIDAHKWFATTMGAGMYLTRDPELLAQVFHVQASYMPSNDQAVDLYVNSMQWSRRFIGVRLFVSLAVGGWAAMAQHIDQSIDLANYLASRLADAHWRIENAQTLAIVCATPPPDSAPVETIVQRVVDSGTGWVSLAKLEGRSVLRACITNHDTNRTHLDALATTIVSAAKP
ncbi:MAG: pyridoxal-dependent decarboxylase [Pseudomonadota bacterium]